MRLPPLTGHPLAVITAVALLTGCSANGSSLSSPSAPTQTMAQTSGLRYHPMMSPRGGLSVLPEGFKVNQRRPSWMKAPPPNAPKGNLAVAQFGTTSVLWFQKNNRPNNPPAVCQPASSTNGIGVDPSGNLWVPNGRANTTTEYAPNCGAAITTIADPTGEPADVGFDNNGNVYIMNINNISGPPIVNVYNSGGTQIGTLSDPSFAVLFGVGTDSNGNVFVSNLTKNNVGNVVEFPGGTMPGTALTGVALGLPGSPVFDASNNLIISDWNAGTIDIFAPPYSSTPTTTPLMGASIWCPLGHNQARIFCGDAENGSIDVYAYPGATYLYSYTSALSPSELVTGVAPAPAAPF